MRKYALVVFDILDGIQDRMDLNYVTGPSGNGFKLKISTISTGIEDIITNVVEEKGKVTFTINQHKNAYQKATVLVQWIQKYSSPEYHMALEYDDGTIVRYSEGRVTNLGKTEKNQFFILPQSFEFTKITPNFIKRENNITIQVSNVGKKYPYTYPYQYGTSIVENNTIENNYIASIPLVLQIKGAIDNPTISLLDENGQEYNTVKINATIYEGEELIINSALRKIYKKMDDGSLIDYIPQVDAKHDTFLKAQSGISTLKINTDAASQGFKLMGSWRQYTL